MDVARLRAMPLFAALSDDLLAELAERILVERYHGRMDVVRQGEAGETMYFLVFGQVEALIGQGEQARQVNVLSPGDYFGEMALLTGAPRSATIRTTRPACLYRLARADFRWLIDREPALEAAVAETVARRRSALNEIGLTDGEDATVIEGATQ